MDKDAERRARRADLCAPALKHRTNLSIEDIKLKTSNIEDIENQIFPLKTSNIEDIKNPNATTIRGTCIDIVFANFHLQPVQEPLSLHFTDHKAVIMKGQRKPTIKV